MEDFTDALLAVLTTVLTILGGWLSYRHTSWSKAQIEKVENDVLRDKLTTANRELQLIVFEISQVLVPEVRKAAADGKVSEEERAQLLERAWTMFEARFTLSWLQDFMARMGFDRDMLRTWVLGKVEAFVFEMKGTLLVVWQVAPGATTPRLVTNFLKAHEENP